MSVDLEKLKAVRTVVTHANCPDGIASAAIIKHALGLPSDAFRFLSYGTREHEELKAEPGMLFCDFTPPAARAMEFLEAGAIVLDHHRSAGMLVYRFEVEGLGAFADEAKEPGVSGALLAYRHTYDPADLIHEGVGQRIREFAEHVGVRDTWQKDDPRWNAACALSEALKCHGERDVLAMVECGFFSITVQNELTVLGYALLAQRKRSVAETVKGAYFATTARHRVAFVHEYADTSDAAELLRERADVVVGFRYVVDEGELKLNASLRGNGTVDVSAIAKFAGGGGHKDAAGFTLRSNAFSGMYDVEHSTPHEAILNVIRDWEAQ